MLGSFHRECRLKKIKPDQNFREYFEVIREDKFPSCEFLLSAEGKHTGSPKCLSVFTLEDEVGAPDCWGLDEASASSAKAVAGQFTSRWS